MVIELVGGCVSAALLQLRVNSADADMPSLSHPYFAVRRGLRGSSDRGTRSHIARIL